MEICTGKTQRESVDKWTCLGSMREEDDKEKDLKMRLVKAETETTRCLEIISSV